MTNKKNTVYMAESWFNPAQEEFRLLGMERMSKNSTIDWNNSFRPIEHQYKNWKITDHPDLLSNKEWQLATFRSDCQAIDAMDIVIALYDPRQENSDPGVLWELGYAFAMKKPTFIILPNGELPDLNLMPALGATNILNITELDLFDFNNKNFNIYDGSVY